jgi:WD40 repeat protein
MVKSIILSTAFALCSLLAHAQKEASVWYFGDKCALDFSNGKPLPVNGSAMTASEGGTSICDANGKLLFYTNGIIVWSRDNQKMPNGHGLKGHDSSTQSGLAVPKPGDPNIVYLFTSDAGAYDNPPNNGVHVSTIDMTKNGGLGDVIEKNVKLLPSAAEKLTAVSHANDTNVWVLAHGWNTNNFYAYLVTKDGVARLPVLSTIGSIHVGGKSNSSNSIGQMKLSPDGKRLAVAMFDVNYFELFDFDDKTGKLSTPRIVYLPTDGPRDEMYSAYGVEFSPDGTKLYITEYWKSKVYQFDPTLSSGAQIMNNAVMVGQSNEPKMASMQLGPDGKIYITKESRFLSVINNPNASGTDCGFVDKGVDVKYGKPQLGLPSFNQSYFYRDDRGNGSTRD